ncbi:MAG: hypothetical protein MJZ40_03830 [Bacteroidaceae bacterium]|nr:hypothetical protein [Bacteroidaceae bacterium]
MATTDIKTITLYVRDDEQLQKIQRDLTVIYTKDDIVLLLKPIYMIIAGCKRLVQYANGTPERDELLEDFMKRRYACNKDTCAHTLALMLCDVRNVEYLLANCQVPHARDIMLIGLKRMSFSQKEVTEGIPTLDINTLEDIDVDGFTYGRTCRIPFVKLEERPHYENRQNGRQRLYCFRLAIRLPFRPLLRAMLMADQIVRPMAELPEGEDVHVFTEGYEAEAKYPQLLMAERTNKLTIGVRGLTAAQLKYAVSNIGLTEFHPAFSSEFHRDLRTRLALSHLLAERQIRTFCSDDYPALLTKLPAFFKRYNLPTQFIFRHIKGFSSRYANDSYSDNICQWLLDYLHDMYGTGQEGWISLDTLLEELSCSDLSENVLGFVYRMSYGGYWGSSSLHNKMTDSKVNFGYNDLTCPYVRALLLSMASVGMFDAALRAPSDKDCSPYDALQYVRITPLGRYALGYTDSYNPAETQNFGHFEADAEHLIVRLVGDNNPYTTVIEEMAQPIGKNRYAFTPQTMMRGISSHGQFMARVELFRTYVDANPPANWEQFFGLLERRFTALMTESLIRYTMYRVSSSDTKLMALLAPGTEIGSLCLHVEGHHILVSRDNQTKFSRLLRDKGYVLV